MPSLKKLTRPELNRKAEEEGIEGAKDLPKRIDVVEAIEAARRAAELANPFGRTARVIAVRGPFGARCLIDVPTDLAMHAFGGRLEAVAEMSTTAAVEKDLATIAERDEDLANSGLAAVAVRLALELDNPYNSATSKAQCAKALTETLDQLRELAPAEEESDGVDELNDRRRQRRGRSATAAG